MRKIESFLKCCFRRFVIVCSAKVCNIYELPNNFTRKLKIKMRLHQKSHWKPTRKSPKKASEKLSTLF